MPMNSSFVDRIEPVFKATLGANHGAQRILVSAVPQQRSALLRLFHGSAWWFFPESLWNTKLYLRRWKDRCQPRHYPPEIQEGWVGNSFGKIPSTCGHFGRAESSNRHPTQSGCFFTGDPAVGYQFGRSILLYTAQNQSTGRCCCLSLQPDKQTTGSVAANRPHGILSRCDQLRHSWSWKGRTETIPVFVVAYPICDLKLLKIEEWQIF